MKTLQMRRIPIFIAAMTLLTFAGNADAGDLKTYSATQCVPLNPSTQNPFIGYTVLGSLSNFNSEQGVKVLCPAVRNSQSDFTGVIQVLDQNADEDIACTLKSISRTGMFIDVDRKFSSGSSPSFQSIVFDTPLTGGAGASIFFECTLPRKDRVTGRGSSILSYSIDEP